MINKYPGTCSCGTRVEAEAGIAVRDGTTGKWLVICGNCQSAPKPASVPASPSSNVIDLKPATYALLSGHPASPYQAAVFDHFKHGRGSAIIKAVAGAGKTTTIKNAVRFIPRGRHVQLYAFNTEAADQLRAAVTELEERGDLPAGHHVRAGTFHSVGFRAMLRRLNLPKEAVRVDDGKCRKLFQAMTAAQPDGEQTYALYGAFATALVGYAKGEGVGALCPDTEESWWRLVEHHGLYLESEDADPAAGVALARALLARSNEAALSGNLDYDDMLYLVVLWKLQLWQNDVVICDEAQDTNPVRRALLRLSLRPGGRLYAVGDPCQSIYGFTGASVDALDLIAREFNTQELPLTVSYRCARAVVERARTWVPYIEASDAAPEGEVLDDIPLAAALALLTAEDAVLCRNSAPLVELAYGLIARGRPCRIMGREIGEGLVNLVEQMRARGLARLVEKLEMFRDREMARFTAKGDERRAEAVSDRVECLLVIAGRLPETERTVPALITRIRAMFDDRPDAGLLTLATVHKAKGQEWPTVAILRPEKMPSKAARLEWQVEQEENLMYVAATRAKTRLVYCRDEDMTIDAEAVR
jgi:DNA helicase-2/ATP-dependent DNA helicase PcrA